MQSLVFISAFWNCLLIDGVVQEIVSGGGKTVWGNPADIGKVLEGSAFDVVLENNGKDLDAVRFEIVLSFCIFCIA